MAKLTISLNQLFSTLRLSALANLLGDDGKLTTSSMKNDQHVETNLSGHPLIHLFYALWQKSKMQKTSKPEISWLSRPLEKASMEIILPQCSCWLKCLEFLSEKFSPSVPFLDNEFLVRCDLGPGLISHFKTIKH